MILIINKIIEKEIESGVSVPMRGLNDFNRYILVTETDSGCFRPHAGFKWF